MERVKTLRYVSKGKKKAGRRWTFRPVFVPVMSTLYGRKPSFPARETKDQEDKKEERERTFSHEGGTEEINKRLKKTGTGAHAGLKDGSRRDRREISHEQINIKIRWLHWLDIICNKVTCR